METLDRLKRLVEARLDRDLPVDSRAVENILIALTKTDDFWAAVRASRELYLVVAKAIEVFADEGLVSIDDRRIVLTESGRAIISGLGVGSTRYRCEACEGKGIVVPKDAVYDEFMKIVGSRPSAVQQYDQGYIRPYDTLARLAFIDKNGDLEGRSIVILGDDDLLSLAALISGKPRRIAVFEIDSRLVDFIGAEAKKRGGEIEIYQHDLRKPLPDAVLGRFDTFVTDPSETLGGLKMFIGRGISALRGPRCAGYFGLTRVEASLKKWSAVQRMIVDEFGCVITDAIEEFHEYVNWDYLERMTGWTYAPVKAHPTVHWYTSTLFRIETVEGFKGLEDEIEEEIYLDDEAASV
ncbi:MAG TPA: putative methyltransferase [Proteobacteria bacterium]|nr:putative methyltransferase [Pseudomonadota bacterium]